MQKYKEFSPTQFDSKGLLGEYHGISEYLVVPVSRTRDSGPMTESNFESALEMLGGESEQVQVHRFGHWGPGWFEIILVNPTSDKATIAEEIEASLEEYPLLNEADASQRELEAACEYWEGASMQDRIWELNCNEESIFAARCKDFSELGERAPRTESYILAHINEG